ncbi:RNA recognition motif domain [Dillenia turbinata]|uniref:RNA recognition motif domain n=1 Tax=Dillenia turbinata TaxID=194707 RepID=A0AAN8UP09_9MAGN
MAYDPYYIGGGGPTIQHQHYNYDTGINTLFISGLPDDVKPREIHNLFRRRPGFDSCQLNHQSAIAALQSLNGVRFDPETGASLHIELARSNSRRKRGPAGGPYVVIDKRQKTKTGAQEISSDDGDEDHNEQYENDDASSKKGDIANTMSGDTAVDSDGAGVATDEHTEKTIDVGDHACSTLFIANLGPNCTEDELKQVLSLYPGFNMLKLCARSGMPVAFADFEKVEQAAEAMQSLQESSLPSSDRGGMHIEYARSKMRKR